MAERVGEHMSNHGVNFKRPAIPTKVEKIEDGTPAKLKVHYKEVDTGEEGFIECNTVSTF
jgi:thioredoxin reductase (NADPH)